jgi:hypothetical protein
MKHEQPKQRAVAAIRTIIAAAKDLAEAEADYLTKEQSQDKRRKKRRSAKCTA